MRKKLLFFYVFTFGMTLTTVYCEVDNQQKLLEQKGKIKYSMAKLRISLIRENEELRTLNGRIVELQKKLMRKLNAQPEMKYLMKQMGKIDRQLNE